MITIDKLDYIYPSEEPALKSLTLTVESGAAIGLIGANGSGKSTLLALLAGLYTPSRGTIAVDDVSSPGMEKELRGVCRLVMQDADLQILGGTVEEDLLLGRQRTESSVRQAKDMAERLSLSAYWDKSVQSLSWGMKRKLCLAAALLDEPSVLLLDEPFSGLDYPGMREMRRIIRSNSEAGLTQIIASHDIECLADIVNEMAVLDNGKLVLVGPPANVLDDVAAYGIRPPCSWVSSRSIVSWEPER